MSAELNHGAAYDPALAGHRLHSVRQDDEFAFGRRGHHARVVECEHKVPCVGYAFSQRERANRFGHTVWSQLRPVIQAHPQTLFVLTHFSLRHSDREILAFFRQQWEQAGTSRLDNVLLWVHPASRLPEQHQQR
ncbi:hypothetical protein [Phytohabitans rumicis]|uniref:Uncharacterized protein n=1 Tax=Phytohabitans rumicis TaxID=1076125 RepID=A0A6V8KXV4_9ACTN|nr:hypothetical protein [Phytohabitans rumicis]GFJ87271.1 hypothetical protein Prum_009130 [Phytohabitans rumicis]